MATIADCQRCTEPCPQAAMANEAAKGRMYATKEMISLMKKVESGQLVEVVRCRDCMHYTNPNIEFCEIFGAMFCMSPDDFCSYGERKDGEE